MKARADQNQDGVVDEAERSRAKQFMRKRFGDNPPGQRGGPGTDWRNPGGNVPGGGNVPEPSGAVPAGRQGSGAGPRFEHPDPNRPHQGAGEGRGKHRGENPPGPRGWAGKGPATEASQ